MSRAFVKDGDYLEQLPERLVSEHPNDVTEAGLAQIEQLKVGTPQTNIFWMDIPAAACEPLRQHLARARIRASIGPRTRLVTHLDVSAADVARTVEVFEAFFAGWHA